MTIAGLALIAAGLILFGVGFVFDADSRTRAQINVATIVAVYFGMVLTFTAELVESSAP